MMQVVARDGDSVLLADGQAGAILLPDGGFVVKPLAVLAGHGQWVDAEGPVPANASANVAERLADLRRKIEAQP